MNDIHLNILREYFGYASFRGIQRELVESISKGNDTLGLMPTGGGKSVTFQVPALAMEGVCIVITPLIALMKDQVLHLREKGILASYVNSSMTYREILQVYDNAVFGGVKFLYLSPERLSTQLFQVKVQQMKVCMIAVDEAHCISQWGYDFRPSYLQISKVRELLPDIPVLALTATATPAVVQDIQRQLCFKKECVFKMSFRRDNLVYVVRHTDDKYRELVHILQSVDGCAIVYTRSRQGTKDVAKRLEKDGIKSTFYHAGLDFAVKDQRQEEWQSDAVRVMVATNAFGMGIDKPNVRLVIHMDCPDSIEAYFQEAGRGGRDGKRSYAVMLYDRSDTTGLMRHVSELFPPKDYIRKVYDHLAYFFQLAVDSGEGASYDFDVQKFCAIFGHFPSRVESAMTILQRAGYLHYDADPDNHPRVQFLMTREQLYRLNEIAYEEDKVVNVLLRTYGNLFADLAYIEIGLLATSAGMDADKIHTTLKELSRRGILKYIPRRHTPRITYIQQRIDSSRLRFPENIYEMLLDRMKERVSYMVEYITANDKCRSQMLLRYFGEESAPCGMCDVCIDAQRKGDAKTVLSVEETIERKIKSGEITSLTDIVNLHYPRKELLEAVERLREDNHIILDGSSLTWKE